MITVSQVLGLMCHPKDISCSTVSPLQQSLFEKREKIASYWPKIEHQNTDDSMCKWGRWQTSYKKCNFTSQWMSTSFGLVFCDITDGRVIKYIFFLSVHSLQSTHLNKTPSCPASLHWLLVLSTQVAEHPYNSGQNCIVLCYGNKHKCCWPTVHDSKLFDRTGAS